MPFNAARGENWLAPVSTDPVRERFAYPRALSLAEGTVKN
jgi:hypothetical protein